MIKKILLSSLSCLVLLTACGKAKSSVSRPDEIVAYRFMDFYYIETNLKSAANHCDGLALEKVNQSLALLQGQLIDQDAHHPKISWKSVESHREGDEADYVFEVTIVPDKIEAIHKQTRLKLRERGGGLWKVTQFSDF